MTGTTRMDTDGLCVKTRCSNVSRSETHEAETSRLGYARGVTNRFRDDAHRRMRTAALDAAAEEVLARGWEGLQMRAVAQRIGVSRQTLYNAFTSKHGLAEALTMRTTDQFLDGVEEGMRRHHDVRASVRDAVAFCLEKAAADPLFRAYLTAEGSREFLPLLTSDGAPVVAACRERVAAALHARHPELDAQDVAVAAETVVRLALSHMLLPLHPADQVADHVADVTARFLGHDRQRSTVGASS